MISPASSDNNSISLVPDTYEKNSSISRSESLTVDYQKSKNISILTSEGDVVTISSHEELHTGYYSYQDITSGNSNLSYQEGEQIELSVEKEFSLSVEGDLSKQEIKDIKKSLKLINRILNGYQSGDIEKVLKNVSKIGKLDSISNLEAAIQQVSSVSYVQQSIAGTVYPVEQNPQEAATDGPAIPVIQDNMILGIEDTGPEEKDTEVSSPNIQKDVNTITDKMVEAVKSTDEKPDKLARSVQKLFLKFMRSFSDRDFHQTPFTNISKMIDDDFYKKISEKKEKEAAHNKYSEKNIENEETPILNNTV
ncbi:MAG: hypothetical protein ACYSTS_02950 [Planctomycetota bacterium]|jgi:uncharacterized protein with von Willebrand factor type A (vWA) domain